MEHTNPTLLPQTHCSGGSCQAMAGANTLAVMAEFGSFLKESIAQVQTCCPPGLANGNFEGLSKAERVQLSESARFSMDEEIVLLRKMIKNFAQAASMAGENDYPDNLAKSLDLLGLTCSRLASVLRVNMLLNGSEDDALRKQIEESLSSFLQENRPEKSKAKRKTKKEVNHD